MKDTTADPTLEAVPTAPAAQKPPSLKRRAIHGSFWTMAGYGANQALRFAGNLALTRLLAPEMFGLMAQVQIVTQGVKMFSDVGLRGSIIHHERGEDPRFLDTAWTLQIIRGALLWLVICLLAWPAATFYETPELKWLIPVVGVSSLISGASSTSIHSLARSITPAKSVLLGVVSRVLSVSAMIVLAVITRSIWALVVGGLVAVIFRAICSHVIIRDYRNRFALDPEAVRELVRFGKWILLSTVMAFLIAHGDRLVLAKLMTDAELGVYSIAFFLSSATVEAMRRMSGSILFPVYARLKERGGEDLRRQTARMRRILLAVSLPPVWVLAIWGRPIIEVLYDERYHEAGWMLQILAVGVIGSVVTATAAGIVLAMGDSFRYMTYQIGRSILTVTGIAVGGVMGGIPGLLIGLSVARGLEYLVLIVHLRHYQVWLPKLDATAFGLSFLVVGTGLSLQHLYGWW